LALRILDWVSWRYDEFKSPSIVIDPGHGGKDRGAKGYGGVKEKDVVLDVSKR